MELQSVGHCPHCGNTAPQRLIGNCSHLHNKDGAHHFLLTQCQTCAEGITYRHIDPRNTGLELSHGRFDLSQYELVWPSTNDLHQCVPQSVRKIYAEASAIRTRAPNAFANQIRRSLEAVCKDRGATGRVLAQSLAELAQRGEIPKILSEMTDVLRTLGNVGSHAGDEEIPLEYVEVIDDFFRAIIEYVYIAPHKVSEFKARLDYARQTGRQPAK